MCGCDRDRTVKLHTHTQMPADIKITGSGAPTARGDTTQPDPMPVQQPVAVQPTEPVVESVPEETPGQSVIVDQPESSMLRRFLLGRDILEEQDQPNDASGAGNAMSCSNEKVEEVTTPSNSDVSILRSGMVLCSSLFGGPPVAAGHRIMQENIQAAVLATICQLLYGRLLSDPCTVQLVRLGCRTKI